MDECTFIVYGEFVTEKSVFGQRSVEIVCYSSENFSSNNFTNISISITAPNIRQKWGHAYINTYSLLFLWVWNLAFHTKEET